MTANLILPPDALGRFLAKAEVDQETGCWLWNGYVAPSGYGQIRIASRLYLAHRASYMVFVGEIPEGLQVDHLCRVTRCMNPSHLEAVTPKENTRRSTAGEATRRRHRAKTHCPQGHPYDSANTSITRSGARRCKACGRAYWRRKAAAS